MGPAGGCGAITSPLWPLRQIRPNSFLKNEYSHGTDTSPGTPKSAWLVSMAARVSRDATETLDPADRALMEYSVLWIAPRYTSEAIASYRGRANEISVCEHIAQQRQHACGQREHARQAAEQQLESEPGQDPGPAVRYSAFIVVSKAAMCSWPMTIHSRTVSSGAMTM